LYINLYQFFAHLLLDSKLLDSFSFAIVGDVMDNFTLLTALHQ